MNVLQTEGLNLSYGNKTIIKQLDLEIPQNKITVLIGGNGCGKSTLLRSLARLLSPETGNILLEGKQIHQYPTKEIAKRMAILPQNTTSPEGMTVLQLVKQGRYPHQTWFQQWSVEDEKKVNWALDTTQMEFFRHHPVDALSGGQRQRAWIAMILAQGTHTLLLDEPTTYLDLSHQIDVLDILRDLNQRYGTTIVMVLHDLNLACRYADHMIAIHQQNIYAEGSPRDIMTEEMVEHVFHMKCMIMDDPLYATPMCIPYSSQKPK